MLCHTSSVDLNPTAGHEFSFLSNIFGLSNLNICVYLRALGHSPTAQSNLSQALGHALLPFSCNIF